jgi:predicted metal-dependent phosphoesterase TrpH
VGTWAHLNHLFLLAPARQDKYKKSQRAAAGADKWLDVKLWDTTPQCIQGLKAAGYKVLVTHLGSHSITLQVGRGCGRQGLPVEVTVPV